MPRKRPAEIIENYRRGQQRRFPFTLMEAFMILLVLAFILLAGYLTFVAKPQLPDFLKFNTLTPTTACECLPTPVDTIAASTLPSADAASTASPTLSATVSNQTTPTPTATQTETPTPSLTPTETLTPIATATVTPSQTATATSATTFNYTVQEGDTLSAIADKFGFTVEQVLAVNDLKDPSFIYVGQIIKIPVK